MFFSIYNKYNIMMDQIDQYVFYFIMQAVFISYVLFIMVKYGVQKSISESYYALPPKLRPLFTFFCWGFAFPAIIVGDSVLMFFAGTGIAFVGAACNMHEEFVRKVHVTAAILGITCAELAIIFDYNMWWLTAAFVVASIILLIFNKKHYIWWIEILAFLTISIALGFKIF
jgi:hypothetical protein